MLKEVCKNDFLREMCDPSLDPTLDGKKVL